MFLSWLAYCSMVNCGFLFRIIYANQAHFLIGTAMSVFCTLAENSTSPVGNSNMAFYIDGELKGTFVNTFENGGGYNYNVPVFTIDYLTPQEHNFTLQNGQVNGTKSLVLLDKIVYTWVFTASLFLGLLLTYDIL